MIKLVSEKLNNLLTTKEYFYEIEANRLIIENDLKEAVDIKKDNLSENIKVCKIAAPALGSNLNFSNIGFYPFIPIYKFNSQDLFRVKSLKCVGSPWTPTFSHYLLLVYSVDYMNYSMVYYGIDNKNYANQFFNGFIYLSENSHKLGELTLEEYTNTIS